MSNLQGSLKDLQRVDFVTSCFLKSTTSARAKIVRKALDTWQPLLDIELGRRTFVDDRSHDCAGIGILDTTAIAQSFDEIRYVPFKHPPHSNFGIVYSYTLGDSPYILHIDDDVRITATKGELESYLMSVVGIMDANPNLLGVNVLSLDLPDKSQAPWKPAEPYAGDPSGCFAHPATYFGTCAGIIRRDLLQRVTLEDIIAFGDKQPAFWERLVTTDTRQFLVATGPTPFAVDRQAWTIQAVAKAGRLRYVLKLAGIDQLYHRLKKRLRKLEGRKNMSERF